MRPNNSHARAVLALSLAMTVALVVLAIALAMFRSPPAPPAKPTPRPGEVWVLDAYQGCPFEHPAPTPLTVVEVRDGWVRSARPGYAGQVVYDVDRISSFVLMYDPPSTEPAATPTIRRP